MFVISRRVLLCCVCNPPCLNSPSGWAGYRVPSRRRPMFLHLMSTHGTTCCAHISGRRRVRSSKFRSKEVDVAKAKDPRQKKVHGNDDNSKEPTFTQFVRKRAREHRPTHEACEGNRGTRHSKTRRKERMRERTQNARTVMFLTPRSRGSSRPMHSCSATLRENGLVLSKLSLRLLPWQSSSSSSSSLSQRHQAQAHVGAEYGQVAVGAWRAWVTAWVRATTTQGESS